jgi:hypothetical protein
MADDQNQEYLQNRALSIQAEQLEAINKLAENRVALENDAYQSIINENNLIENQLKALREQNKEGQQRVNEQRELNKLNRDLLGISRSISSVTASELGSEKLIKQLAKDKEKTASQILQLEKLKAEYKNGESELEKDIAISIGYQINNAKKLNEELARTYEISQAINEDGFLKTFSTLKHVIDLIPGLNKILPGFNQAAESYRKALILGKQPGSFKGLSEDKAEAVNKKIQAYREGDKGGMKGMNKDFIQSLPKELQETLKGTTGTAALAILSNKFKDGVAAAVSPLRAAFLALQQFLKQFILIQFVSAILKADKTIGNMAKSFNVSYQEATLLQNKMNQIASTSGSIFVTGTKTAETQLAINKLYGTTAMATREQLLTMTELREAAGFTNEELQGVLGISLATGKEMEAITGEVIAQAKYTGLKHGVSLNEREIVKEISKVSAATTLSLGKNPGLISKAISTAKALGMELSKIEGIASSILNFESSIEDELSAELLLGRELNLEAARYYALNNDIAGVAEEIASQIGTAADFMGMNYLQQNALAKAVGMNREELAKTLYVQEQLAGLSGEEAKRKEDILNKRIAEVGLAQAMNEMAEGGYETLEQQASQQEKIVAMTEKLSELFAQMAPTIMMAVDAIMMILTPITLIVDLIGLINMGFEWMFGWIGKLIPNLGIFGKIMKGIAAIAIVIAAYKAYAAVAGALAATVYGGFAAPFAGAAAAAAVMAAGMGTLAGLSKADDMMSHPTAGAGYGDRILVDRAAGTQTALNNSDTISATKAGSSPAQSAPVVKLYLDNEEIANSQMKGMSRI